uniref:Uncharacterized protein LOC114335408 n=1 Tax=Diabrotica virgifera virgifera TaxID=50390 RepID=A0A6P7FY78_DIAVI
MIVIIYGFANDFPQTQIKIESGVGSPTIVDWCNFCREVCTRYLQEHPVEIKGFDENGQPITVEIDESYFFPRKYNRGAYRPGRWIFGAVERNSGKLFVIPVAAKSEEILLPIISRMILPGSIILSFLIVFLEIIALHYFSGNLPTPPTECTDEPKIPDLDEAEALDINIETIAMSPPPAPSPRKAQL